MAAGRRPSLRCVKRRLRTRNRLVRTSRSPRPPSLACLKTSRQTGPVRYSTTTAIVRVSHSRMCRIIRAGLPLPTTRASGSPMSKTIRASRQPTITRDNRSPMCKTIRTGRRCLTTPDNRRQMCKAIQTGPRPPITPVSSHKAINKGIRPQATAGKNPITIVRLTLGRSAQTPPPL